MLFAYVLEIVNVNVSHIATVLENNEGNKPVVQKKVF